MQAPQLPWCDGASQHHSVNHPVTHTPRHHPYTTPGIHCWVLPPPYKHVINTALNLQSRGPRASVCWFPRQHEQHCATLQTTQQCTVAMTTQQMFTHTTYCSGELAQGLRVAANGNRVSSRYDITIMVKDGVCRPGKTVLVMPAASSSVLQSAMYSWTCEDHATQHKSPSSRGAYRGSTHP